jgi:DNA-binding CsgD family transcriptional regulator
MRRMKQDKYNERLHAEAEKRARKYKRMRSLGMTLQQIADAERISRQAVHALLRRHGMAAEGR